MDVARTSKPVGYESTSSRSIANGDKLVESLFAAVRRSDATPEERRLALVRAGLIAQAYNFSEPELMESIFGLSSSSLALQYDGDLYLGSGDDRIHGGS